MRQHHDTCRISAAPGEASRRNRRGFSGLLRSIRTKEDGQAVLEFALVLPLLAALVLIFVQFGKAVYFDINLTHLASEGVRVAVVNPAAMPDGSTSIAAFLCSSLNTAGGDADKSTVFVSYPPNTSKFPATSKLIGDPITIVVKS